MIAIIAPASGGVAHVSRAIARAWTSEDVRTMLISVAETGSLRGATCTESDLVGEDFERPNWLVPVALRAALSAWRHRRCCLATAQSLHVELGRTSRGTFWFALAAGVIRRNIPMVVVAHDMPVVVRHASAALVPLRGRWAMTFAYRVIVPLLDGIVMRVLRRRADATIVLAAGAATAARDGGWPMVSQAVHGADPASEPGLDPMLARTVLLAGYLGPGKGLEILAEAWSTLNRYGTDLSLVIAGSATEVDQEWLAPIRAQLDAGPRRPTWLGYVTDDEFADLIANAAVVVLPYETSNPASGPLVRALVEGRAVVATRVPAVVDEVIDGVNGLLVEPGDPVQLADALRRLMDDGALRRKLGRSAAAMAAKHSWSEHVHVLGVVHAGVANLSTDSHDRRRVGPVTEGAA